MIFGKSSLLAAILGGNGKEERLKKEEARTRAAQAKLSEVIAESSRDTCRAVQHATSILGADESLFDLDVELLQAEKTLSIAPSRPTSRPGLARRDKDLEAA